MGRGVGAVALAALALGCGDGAGAADAMPAPDAGLSEVTGTAVREHRTAAGSEEIPVDLTDTEIAAWVERGDGSSREIPGTGAADGTFVIPEVPEVPVLITVGNVGTVTSAREIDFGEVVPRRPDVAAPTASTAIVLDAAVDPWSQDDRLAAFSENAGVWDLLLFRSDGELIPPETTELGGYELTWFGGLLEEARGDRLSVVHYRTINTLEGHIFALEVFRAGPLSISNGSTTSISGDFEPLPLDSTLEVEWNIAAWGSFWENAHPQAEPFASPLLGVYAYPGGRRDGLFAFWPVLLELRSYDSPVHSAEYRYGNPFPERFPVAVRASTFFTMSVEVPGEEDPVRVLAAMSQTIPIEDYDPAALTVALTPPGPVSVEGNASVGPIDLDTATPMIRWRAPQLGEPTAYRLEVLRADETPLFPQLSARFVTEERSLRIPPGVLEPGASYVFRAVALQMPAVELTEHPNRYRLPVAAASGLSGLARVRP